MDLSTREGRKEQGGLIQRAVERAGLSIEELANRIGCSRALLYQYLSGTTLAQPDRLQIIARVTGVSLAWFYGSELAIPQPAGPQNGADPDAVGRIADRLSQLEELAHAQESPADWAALATTSERITTLAAQALDTAIEARSLARLGKARIHMGEFSLAVDPLLRASTLFETLNDSAGEADARQALGNVLLATGRAGEARTQFERVAGSTHWAGQWCGAISLAAVHEQMGDYKKAMELCDTAAAIVERGPDARSVAHGTLYVNANRVNLFLACGDYEHAERLASECRDAAEALGDGGQHLEARLNLATIHLQRSRLAEAVRPLQAALTLALFVRDAAREIMVRALLAQVDAAMGAFEAAIAGASDALARALAQADHRTELFAQMALADAYCGAGRYTEARYHINQALAVASALRLTLYESECRLKQARIALRSGDTADVDDIISRADAQATELGARHLVVFAVVLRAQALLARQSYSDSRELARSAYRSAYDLGMPWLQWEALSTEAAAALAETGTGGAAAAVSGNAVMLIEAARSDLRSADLADSLLEDVGILDVYVVHARALRADRGDAAAQGFVDGVGWPPLAARFAAA